MSGSNKPMMCVVMQIWARGGCRHLIDVSSWSKPCFILYSWPASRPSPKGTVDLGPNCMGAEGWGVGKKEDKMGITNYSPKLFNSLKRFWRFYFIFQLTWKGLKISCFFSLTCKYYLAFLAQTCCFWSLREISMLSHSTSINERRKD